MSSTVNDSLMGQVQYRTCGVNGLDPRQLALLPPVFADPDLSYGMLYARILDARPNQYQVLVEAAAMSAAGYDDLTAVVADYLARYPDLRVLISLQDGTVIYDSAAPVGTGPGENSYANFLAKSINENHNTRVAILDAQLGPLGLGYETKYSTTTTQEEAYVALRLGDRRASSGTFRVSQPLTLTAPMMP